MWQQVFETMTSTWRCIGFDHRGSGATSSGAEEITRERLVADLSSVLDACNVDRCVLAGESAGGITALDAAAAAPDRFAGLVLVDSLPSVTREVVADLIEGSRRDYRATVARFVEACVPEKDAEHLKRWGRQMLMRSDGETAAQLLECLIGRPPNLSAITMPTLVLRGELDTIAPPEAAATLADGIRGASFRMIPGAGHVPTVTAPDAVAREIESWATSIYW
jgi:pimeloyl-ACP methyl ester carboxylesterase